MEASEALSLVALSPVRRRRRPGAVGGAGWNQTADDWAFFIQHGHAIGFRTASGVLVATAAALAYGGGFGWISMVLVAPDWRHRGLASLLIDELREAAARDGITPVLDATPAGQPVYRRLGFRAGLRVRALGGHGRLRASAVDRSTAAGSEARGGPLREADAIAHLDAIATSASGRRRRAAQAFLLARAGTRAWMARDGSGFAIVRDGQRAAQFGPLVAADPARRMALFGARAARACRARSSSTCRRAGASSPRRSSARLRAPAPVRADGARRRRRSPCGDRLFALAGPEFG